MKNMTRRMVASFFGLVACFTFATKAIAETVATPLSIEEINRQLAEISLVSPRSIGNFWMLYGHSERMDSGGKGSNNFYSGMLEYRPWGQDTQDGRLDYGGYLRAEYGEGKAGTKKVSNYNWTKYGGGVNAKYWSNQVWDLNLRLGVRQEENNAKGSSQETTSMETAANVHVEQGRKAQRFSLTEGDLFVQYVQPVSTEKTSSSGKKLVADKKRATDLKGQLGLLDWKVGKGNVLVPLIGAGTGTTGVGSIEKIKFNYLLGLKWRHKGHDRLTFKAENEHIGSRLNTTGIAQFNWEF